MLTGSCTWCGKPTLLWPLPASPTGMVVDPAITACDECLSLEGDEWLRLRDEARYQAQSILDPDGPLPKITAAIASKSALAALGTDLFAVKVGLGTDLGWPLVIADRDAVPLRIPLFARLMYEKPERLALLPELLPPDVFVVGLAVPRRIDSGTLWLLGPIKATAAATFSFQKAEFYFVPDATSGSSE